jgi:hypothetical protein
MRRAVNHTPELWNYLVFKVDVLVDPFSSAVFNKHVINSAPSLYTLRYGQIQPIAI